MRCSLSRVFKSRVAARSLRSALPRAMSSNASPRCLSIQSHVVHGYVGNKAAVFPLQLLGFEVDSICSVQLSNHTGYPSWTGSVMDGQQLAELLKGLQANGLTSCTHLLTGYIGSVSLLKGIAEVLTELRKTNPSLTYVCDPVMGDDGRLYVPKDLLPAYRSHIVAEANVLTPNQFEAELLTGVQIDSRSQAVEACNALHDMGPQTVVITSIRLQQDPDKLLLIASTRLPQRAGCPAQLQVLIPKLDGYFTGTGDLLTALLLAWLHKHPDNLQAVVENALGTLQGVLLSTAEAAGDAASSKEHSAEVSKRRELKLVQNQNIILNPPVKLRAASL